MYRALTAEQARSIEEQAIARQGVTLGELMRAAGAAIAREVAERVPHGEVVVLAGPGNNGGDGWVAAREMAAAGRPVRVLSLKDPSALTGDAAHAASDAIAAGVPWRLLPEMPAEDDLASAVVVVDALLGTGSSGALRAPLDEWVVAANASGAYMVSADVPTGVDSDSGAVPGPAIQADCTVTFTAPKRGLVLYPGAAHAGEVIVADIGIDPGLADVPGALEVWVREEYASLLPLPAPDVHKNRRGRVLVVAGSGAFPGAAVLAARGAMRSGAGYVTLAVPDSVVPIAQAHLLAVPVVGLPQSSRTRTLSSAAADKVLQLAREYDAVVLGPGLTVSDGAAASARSLVRSLDKPLVVDADALNALVDAQELIEQRTAPTVLTPHPGELARLLGVSTDEVQADRVFSASRLAGPGRVVVLKGAGTVVAGAGRQLANTSGTPALATAGTGDVLAGVIGALLAQRLVAFDAAALGAFLHGLAGEAAAAELTPVCVTAEDIPAFLGEAVADLLDEW